MEIDANEFYNNYADYGYREDEDYYEQISNSVVIRKIFYVHEDTEEEIVIEERIITDEDNDISREIITRTVSV